MSHPTLVTMRGLPGSGKSYLTNVMNELIAKQLGEGEIVILDPDTTNYSSPEYLAHAAALTAEGVDAKLHAYRFLRAKAYKGIEQYKLIIWNQPFTNLEIFNKMITGLQTYAKEHNTTLPVLIVEVEIDPATAKERVTSRKLAGGHGPSDNTFARFINDYSSFASHGYNTLTIQGTTDAQESATKVIENLQKILA